MISNAKTVDEYLESVPAQRKQALIKIRNLCNSILKGYNEIIEYGGPGYAKNGKVEIGFMSQKQHITFYCLKHRVMLDNKDLLKGLNHGKGAIRFSNPDKIDYNVIEKLLVETNKSSEEAC